MNSAKKNKFLKLVEEEVQRFYDHDTGDDRRVLLFKGFTRQMRFLTHQRVSDVFAMKLTTKSIGAEPDRFLCVCYTDRVLDRQQDKKLSPMYSEVCSDQPYDLPLEVLDELCTWINGPFELCESSYNYSQYVVAKRRPRNDSSEDDDCCDHFRYRDHEFLDAVAAEVDDLLEDGDDEFHERILVMEGLSDRQSLLIRRNLGGRIGDGRLVAKSIGLDPDRYLCICYAEKVLDEQQDKELSPMVFEEQDVLPEEAFDELRSWIDGTFELCRSDHCGYIFNPKRRKYDFTESAVKMKSFKEDDFLALVMEEIRKLYGAKEHDLVLFLEGLNKRLRYLIHQRLNKDFHSVFTTKSFGDEPDRVLCVSYADKVLDVRQQQKIVAVPDELQSTFSLKAYEELCSSLRAPVQLCRCVHDYMAFIRQDFESNYTHVLELYELQVGFKEKDVLEEFAKQREEHGFEILAVSGTSVLGIFSSAAVAAEALKDGSKICKLRPLGEASKEVLAKAALSPESLVAAKKRPKISSASARRMIGHALGLQARAV